MGSMSVNILTYMLAAVIQGGMDGSRPSHVFLGNLVVLAAHAAKFAPGRSGYGVPFRYWRRSLVWSFWERTSRSSARLRGLWLVSAFKPSIVARPSTFLLQRFGPHGNQYLMAQVSASLRFG